MGTVQELQAWYLSFLFSELEKVHTFLVLTDWLREWTSPQKWWSFSFPSSTSASQLPKRLISVCSFYFQNQLDYILFSRSIRFQNPQIFSLHRFNDDWILFIRGNGLFRLFFIDEEFSGLLARSVWALFLTTKTVEEVQRMLSTFRKNITKSYLAVCMLTLCSVSLLEWWVLHWQCPACSCSSAASCRKWWWSTESETLLWSSSSLVSIISVDSSPMRYAVD